LDDTDEGDDEGEYSTYKEASHIVVKVS